MYPSLFFDLFIIRLSPPVPRIRWQFVDKCIFTAHSLTNVSLPRIRWQMYLCRAFVDKCIFTAHSLTNVSLPRIRWQMYLSFLLLFIHSFLLFRLLPLVPRGNRLRWGLGGGFLSCQDTRTLGLTHKTRPCAAPSLRVCDTDSCADRSSDVCVCGGDDTRRRALEYADRLVEVIILKNQNNKVAK
jgi:hypothetical protein